MKEGLKLLPGDKNCVFSLILPLILLPTEVDAVTQEGCCKGNRVGAFGSSGGKVILTPLIEVIAFHVGLITINVRWSSLQWLLTGTVKEGSLGFEDCLEDLLQILFRILSNRRFSRGIDWSLIIARLRRRWRSRWIFGGAFPARASTASDGGHPDSRSGMERILNNVIQTNWLTR